MALRRSTTGHTSAPTFVPKSAPASGTLRPRARGFTLVELSIAIVLLGIVSLMVTNFATAAMRSYLDAERRAELVDTTETALRRLQRDVRLSLPNSIRVTTAGGVVYLEFLPVVTGGRYRTQSAGATPPGTCGIGANNPLTFGVSDSSFSSIGPVADLPAPFAGVGAGFIVIYNLGAGFSNADAYATGNATGGNKSILVSTASSACESTLTFAAHTFTLASPSGRFHLVQTPVTYACNLATGQLVRYGGYAISAAQPTPPAGTPALVLDAISACAISYNPNAVSQRIGVVSVVLVRTLDGESVRLYQDVRVDNAP
ncbi:MAG: type II secretion system protein [Proteobacteria bacterium]|nr:type II secretion system protein [Burkholderiales bacterium]